MRITAIVEQAQDGAWSACTPGVMVYASTREEALQGVRNGAAGLLEYLSSQGWQFFESGSELVSLEVDSLHVAC
jgi:predicted RNase H-like HicB family nuclease